MLSWQILCIVGILFVILEIFTPSMFFLNFALAAFITAVLSIYIHQYFVLVLVFFIFSFLSFVFLRPLIIQKNKKENETGISSKYIGKEATVLEDISETEGVISIYDERWVARSYNNAVYKKGAKVIIVKNDGLTMYVKND